MTKKELNLIYTTLSNYYDLLVNSPFEDLKEIKTIDKTITIISKQLAK